MSLYNCGGCWEYLEFTAKWEMNKKTKQEQELNIKYGYCEMSLD